MLNDTVIANGYCVGCGACAVPADSPFKITFNVYGQFQAKLNKDRVHKKITTNFEKLCPFGDGAPNEDVIAKELFESHCNHNTQVGYYNGVFAGYVSEGKFRDNGSSGGMGTWVLNELLSQRYVDHIIHVCPSDMDCQAGDGRLFKYDISETVDKTQKGSKSRYYPIELSKVLHTVRTQPGCYAIIGLPCFIKSVRLLQMQDPVLQDRIKYCIGLICGHLKSSRYGESLAWQIGVKPTELRSIDFRVKDPSQPANRYGTSVTGDDGKTHVMPTNELFGTDWGAGAF